MDYYAIRGLIVFAIFIILIFILINKKIYKILNLKIKNWFVTIMVILLSFIIICSIIWYFPYEGTILKFSNVDNIITHFIEKDKIIRKYVFDDYAFVLYNYDDNLIPKFMSFSKNEKGEWTANNMSYFSKEKMVTAYNNLILVSKIPSKNSVAIEIYSPYAIKDEEYQISDSLNSKFDTFIDTRLKYKNLENKYDNIVNVVILDEEVDQNYTLYLNGREYKPFK